MQEVQIGQSEMNVPITIQKREEVLRLLHPPHSCLPPLLTLKEVVIEIVQQLQGTVKLHSGGLTELI